MPNPPRPTPAELEILRVLWQRGPSTVREVNATLQRLRQVSVEVHPTQALEISRHEPDNRFLECVLTARADFLVTGNTKHFPKRYRTTHIVSARDFLAVIALP